jgi:hypothetical protein
MPKGRHLKPDFFTDKNIVGMSPLARLLYQGLWCYAADCGHLDDEPLELKMRILPADNCEVDDLLDELAWHKRIIRKGGVLELPKLAEHQKPDKRYATQCDACKAASREAESHDVTTMGNGSPEPPNTTGSHSDHGVPAMGPHGDHAADGDGDGDGDGEVMVRAPKRRATTIPRDWKPSPAHGVLAVEQNVSLVVEAQKFRDSAIAKGRTYIDWDAAFRNWLRSQYAAKIPAGDVDWMRRRPQ